MINKNYKYKASNKPLQGFQNLEGVISQNQQGITYTPFNKTATIEEGNYYLEIEYGVDNHRVKSVLKEGEETIRTKFFTSLGIEKIIEGDEETELTYVPVGDAVAIYVNQNGNKQWYYVYKDLLGSFSKVTDEDGILVYEQSFDAWGRKTNPEDWNYENIPEIPTWLRGYTGHEHLPEFDLINMNGRVYDPKLGRMLSPDNYVQSPLSSQSYNRYAYVWNNPLKYNDPSGDAVAGVVLLKKLTLLGLKGGGAGGGLYILKVATSPGVFNEWDWKDFGYSVAGGAINGVVGGYASVPLFKKGIIKIAAGPKFKLSSNGISVGGNLSFDVDAKYFAIGYDITPSYNFKTTGTEEYNKFGFSHGFGIRYGTSKNNVTIYSTIFSNPEQQVGGVGINIGKFNLRYENDGAPMSNMSWLSFTNDGEDRYRTAAARIGYGNIHIQLNLFTGDPGTNDYNVSPTGYSDEAPNSFYEGGNVDDYRLGALAIGYGNFRIGMNSEGIRHTFQNEFAHNTVSPQPYFRVLNNDRHLYYNWGTTSRYTLW